MAPFRGATAQGVVFAAAFAALSFGTASGAKAKSGKPGVELHKALRAVARAGATALNENVPPNGWDDDKESARFKTSGLAVDLGASFGPGLQRHMKKMGMKSYAVAQAGDPFDDDRPRLLTSESAWKNTARTAGRKLLQDDLLDGKVPLSNADLVASVGWGHLVDDGSWTAAMGVYEALKPGILVMSSSAPGEAECLSCWGAPNSRRCREVMDTLGAERLRSGTNLSLPSPLQGERYPLQWIDGLFQENLELSLQWTAALRDNLIGRAVLLGEKLPEFKGLYKRNAKGNEDVDLSAGVPGRITDAPPTDTAEHSDAELEGFTGGLPEGLPAEEISAEDRAGIFMSASRVAEWLKLVYLAKNVLVMRRFDPSEKVDAQFALDESFGFTSEMLHWF